MPGPDDLLTPAEAAAVTGVDVKTVARWADAGRLAAVRTLGGRRRYWRGEVEALAAARARPGDWVSIVDVASAMNVHGEVPWKWARAGLLPGAVKDARGYWLIPKATLDALLAGDGTP